MNNKIKSKLQSFAISILAVIIGLLIGAIIIAISGYNPSLAFTGIIQGTVSSPSYMGNWLAYSAPLILTGLSIGFAYKTGLFNIGAEGQFLVASFTATYLGATLTLPAGIHAIVAILGATLVAVLWALIPGILKAFWGVSEVVITIMLNWIALYYTNYLIESGFNKGDVISQTPSIKETASLKGDLIQQIFPYSNASWGILIAIVAVFVYWFILNKTTFGYEIKAVGSSPDAAKYAGVKTKSRIIWTMAIAGAFAGLAGAIYSLGNTEYITSISAFRNFGFDGIAVAMLGQINAVGILLSGLLFGALRNGAAFMGGVPTQIIDIMMAVIIIVSALGPLIQKKLTARKGGK